MALDYTYTKYKDVYTLTNNAVDELTYTIINVSCDSETEISNGTISTNNTKELSFKLDGRYNILLDNGEEQETIEVLYFENLLKSFIDSTESTICGCKKCKECEECSDCEEILNTITLANSYKIINNPLYDVVLPAIENSFICDFESAVQCNTLEQMIKDENINIEILKKVISFYYLTFLNTALFFATDEEERKYISNKFNSIKIIKCIKKLGLQIGDINSTINDVLNTQNAPTHVSNMYWSPDFTTVGVLWISILLMNYEDPNNNPPAFIRFENVDSLECTYRLGNNQIIEQGVEYSLAPFTVLKKPIIQDTGITDLDSPTLNTSYQGRLLTILSQPPTTITGEDLLIYSVRNAISPVYTSGTIATSIL